MAKKLDPKRVVSNIVQAILDLHHLQDDRSIGIMACAILESELGRAILMRFREMSAEEQNRLLDNNGHGAIATLAAKIWIGFAVGLYKEQAREDLLTLKKIRNDFAHVGDHIDFSNADIIKDCNKLVYPKLNAESIMKPEETDPKERYLDTICHLAAGFNSYAGQNACRPPAPQFISY